MRAKAVIILFLGINLLIPYHLVVALSNQPEGKRQIDKTDIIPGELIVGMKPGFSITSFQFPEEAFYDKSRSGLIKLNAGVIKVPPGQEEKFIGEVKKRKGVLFVEPNYRVEASLIPNDTDWSQQYGPAQIQAPAAWDITTGSTSVILAIIDSGLDVNHPEFSGRLIDGYDIVDHDNIPQDLCGHGTHVTGIAAATGNNSEGIAGISWGTRIMPVRVLGADCKGSIADVAEGIIWAVERDANVINLSLGILSPSSLLENATYHAYRHGTAIFAAAGNQGLPIVAYPAAYAWVMAVGATGSSGSRMGFSNTGAPLDLMAPGDNIYSSLPTTSNFFYHNPCPISGYPCGKATHYDTLDGTSMASAFAAGAATLLASLPSFSTADQIYQALTETALDMEAPGLDDNTGHGLIQLADALLFNPTASPPPDPVIPVEYDMVTSFNCSNLVQYDWRDATTSGTARLFIPGSNSGYAQISLPFNFNYGGQAYDMVTAHSNGYLSMGNNTSIVSTNFIIPGIAQPNNFIAPFWDNLTTPANGVLYVDTFGTAPNQEFVIAWTEMQRTGFPNTELEFEIVLFENSGNVLLQYRTLKGTGSDGASATVGLEYANGEAGREYSYNKAGALIPELALLFMPYPNGNTPPSSTCTPTSFASPVDSTGGFFDAPPFCVSIGENELQHEAILQIHPLISVPPMPASYLDLHHYADITLNYSPPSPLSPLPIVYVCYHYTPEDVLAAGGHPENLFITAYDSAKKKWDKLLTSVDIAQSLLMAQAPHFSYYAVATTASTPEELPVTGASISREFLRLIRSIGIAAIILVILTRILWQRTKRKRISQLK